MCWSLKDSHDWLFAHVLFGAKLLKEDKYGDGWVCSVAVRDSGAEKGGTNRKPL